MSKREIVFKSTNKFVLQLFCNKQSTLGPNFFLNYWCEQFVKLCNLFKTLSPTQISSDWSSYRLPYVFHSKSDIYISLEINTHKFLPFLPHLLCETKFTNSSFGIGLLWDILPLLIVEKSSNHRQHDWHTLFCIFHGFLK